MEKITRRSFLEGGIATAVVLGAPKGRGEATDDTLRKLAERGLEKRFAQFLASGRVVDRKSYRERLEHELEIIADLRERWAQSLIVVADYVRFARQQRIPVGPGRYTVAASLVAYVLEITEVDPLEFGLIFERFLRPNYISNPCIYLDFCLERRDEVIAYAARRHGQDRVSRVARKWRLDEKEAIRRAGAQIGASDNTRREAIALFPYWHDDDDDYVREIGVCPQLIEQSCDIEAIGKKNRPLAALLKRANQIQKGSDHVMVHPSAILISNEPVRQIVPVKAYRAKAGMPRQMTEHDWSDVEVQRHPVFYLIGIEVLSKIDRAVRLVEQRTGRKLPAIRNLPLDDPAVYAMLGKGDNDGLFELGFEELKPCLRRLKPDRFSDIAALYALYRPGSVENSLMEQFIEAKRGCGGPGQPDAAIEPILKETYGILIYREQLMQIAHDVAGCTYDEAESLCKTLAMEINDDTRMRFYMEEHEKFVSRAVGKGLSRIAATRLLDFLGDHCIRVFPKAHAIPYMMISFQTAWLKAHFPREFSELFTPVC